MMKLIAFGPRATFSHQLALELVREETEILLKSTIDEVCQALADNPDCIALLPLRNSISGAVRETERGFEAFGMEILARYRKKIGYVLAGWASPSSALRLIVHPHALRQCKSVLHLCPQAEKVETTSNALSGLALQKDREAIAIVPLAVAETYGLPILKEIKSEANQTEFVLVRSTRSPNSCPAQRDSHCSLNGQKGHSTCV